MNKVILMGRLTRDPDVRWTQGQEQTCTARFTLAVDRRVSKSGENQQTADFIACTAYGKTGEVVEKHLRQGTKILIGGHLRTGSYTNKDNQKVYTTDVVVSEISFCESKGTGNTQQAAGTATDQNGFAQIPDGIDEEELPFA